LFLGMVVYREMSIRDLAKICITVGREIASILIIIAMGMMFGWIMTLEQIPQDVAGLISYYHGSPNILILIVILVILFLGCFMEVTVLLLLLPPIIVPPLVALGFDPLHLGIVIILTLMIGMYHPPFGVGLFAMQRIAQITYAEVVWSVLPWLIPLLGALLVLAYVPWLTTVVPRYFGF
jgi:TRAP-type C4-dicarboxylate transport system permease large subunit